MSSPNHARANPGNTIVLVASNGATASTPEADSIAVSGFNGTSESGPDGISICGAGGYALVDQYGLAYVKGGNSPVAANVANTNVAQVGSQGIAIVRASGRAVSGPGGVSIATAHDHDSGIAETSDNGGIAISLEDGIVAAGAGSIVIVRYLNPAGNGWLFKIGLIGKVDVASVVQTGLASGTAYTLDANHKFKPAP